MSLFVWYFGTRRQYPDVGHHTIVLGPRYRELLTDIFERKHLADDFSLYLHRPTASDPSLAPPGCDAFYVLAPVPHLESGTDWQAMAEPYRRRIAAHLERTLLPGLEEAVVTSRMMTPAGLPGPSPLLPRGGVRARARADPERLVPPPQPERGGGRAFPGRGRNAPWSRRAGCALIGPRSGQGGAGCRELSLKRDHATAADLAACRELLRQGSRTFHAASLLLPDRVRGPAASLYAFCRLADDAIDLHQGRLDALPRLLLRLTRAYAGRPLPHPVDRAFADMVGPPRRPARPCRWPCSRASPGTRRAAATRPSRTSRPTPPGSPARWGR